MNVHHFHPETGDYLGASEATADPMEPGRWLVPAWATTDEPPAPVEGKRRCYVIPGTDAAPATQHGQAGAWELRDLAPEA